MQRICAFVIGLVVAMPWLAGSAAFAASNGVRDEAHFFSPGAIEQANRVIQQIDQRYHKDVLVETLPAIPQELQSQLQSQDRNEFFRQWADQRAIQEGVNGVYILITRAPGRVEVAAGSDTERRAFDVGDRDQLARDMLLQFRQRQYDKGLVAGVQFIQQRMSAHLPLGRSQTSSQTPAPYSLPPYYSSRRGNTSWSIGGLACLIVGIVLLVIIIRGIFGRSGSGYYGGPGGYYPPGGGYPPGGYGYGGGGGGFGRGFLGGLLGGALGGWALNQWEQRGQSGYAPPPSSGDDYSSGADTSFSATGGDFDAGGSGGDFGGASSSGGGDFGGGGGGGGDFGGGGGDSGGSSGGDF